MNNFVALLLSAGGAAFLTALITGIRNLSSSKMESEAALMKRLNDAIKDGTSREHDLQVQKNKEEERADLYRRERDMALDLAARYRRILINHGISPEDEEESN